MKPIGKKPQTLFENVIRVTVIARITKSFTHAEFINFKTK